jgi:signal transduction histidine kinase
MDELSPSPAEQVPADPGRRLARAERILACFQKALGHDLPNQIVALQGVLQVLELEEGSRLSTEGRDYLQRLSAITGRLREALLTLRAIGRAGTDLGVVEEISLAELAREAAAEVKQLLPGRAITYHLRFPVATVKTYRRPLQRAVVELVRALGRAGAEPIHVYLDSRPAADGVELSVSTAPAAAGVSVPGDLTLALVRELADAWGGRLTAAERPGEGPCFTLLLCSP